jgi:hypothetical protein
MAAPDGTLTSASKGSQVVGMAIDANYFLIAHGLSSPYPTILLFERKN